jgi:hypothetical protein|nr:MAG TPA: hypothetical protein [Caudoviricetes sp.]
MKKLIFGILSIVITLFALWLLGLGVIFSVSKVLLIIGITMAYNAMTSVYLVLLVLSFVALIKLVGSLWK